MKRLMCVVSVAAGMTVSAATVNFLGTKSLDLADPENWSASEWTAFDTLVISKDNATLPAAGLYLSANLPQSAEVQFNAMPNYTVEVNFGGYSLNTKKLTFGNMHDDNNRDYYLKAVGGFAGVDEISDVSMKGHVRFYDGIYRVRHYLTIGNWFPYLYVSNGAELVFEDQNKEQGIIAKSNASGAQICMDGGKFIVMNHSGSDVRWQRDLWGGSVTTRSTFTIKNGGEYRDDSINPANSFVEENFTIRDAGYFETNATCVFRNTLFAGSNNAFLITNSIFRVAQLYCGYYRPDDSLYGNELDTNLSNATVDFCDSEETFAFQPGCGKTTAGMIVPNTAKNNSVRFRGSKNRFTSQTFVFGGNNRLSIEGGAFAVSNSFDFIVGSGASLTITNAEVYLGSFNANSDATNAVIQIAEEARVKVGSNLSPGGVGGSLTVKEGTLLSVGKNRFNLASDGQSMSFSGSVSTGSVCFAANDGCVVFSKGAYNWADIGPGWTRLKPFDFYEGKTNNVFVISNATCVCDGTTYKSSLKTAEGPKSEAVPYTNCPGCRIEFRGSSPILSIINGQTSESSGQDWYSAAFGEMINADRTAWTTTAYPLKDALRLRYVLPPSTAPYRTAPLNVTKGVLVLGGNAEFEFDMTDFDWPDEAVTIPLAYNETAYNGWNNRKYINIAQLNETNRGRLPVGPDGRTSHLELAADGKTLNLVINHAKRGLSVIVR